jgi:Tubulin binding cofactor C
MIDEIIVIREGHERELVLRDMDACKVFVTSAQGTGFEEVCIERCFNCEIYIGYKIKDSLKVKECKKTKFSFLCGRLEVEDSQFCELAFYAELPPVATENCTLEVSPYNMVIAEDPKMKEFHWDDFNVKVKCLLPSRFLVTCFPGRAREGKQFLLPLQEIYAKESEAKRKEVTEIQKNLHQLGLEEREIIKEIMQGYFREWLLVNKKEIFQFYS